MLGRELDPIEARLLAIFKELKALCAEELPPVAHANVRSALAVYANVVNGLALAHEHLVDLDV